MKKLFAFALTMVMTIGAWASDVNDLVAISGDYTMIFEQITAKGTASPTAGSLYFDNHLLTPVANSKAANKGSSTIGETAYLNCLRLKNDADYIVFKVSGPCKITFYTQSHSSRGVGLAASKTTTYLATQPFNSTVWEYDLTATEFAKYPGGVIYAMGNGGDFFIAGIEFTFAAAEHNITYTSDGNGTVSGPATGKEGATVNVTVTPNSGKRFDHLTVNGTDQAAGVASFVMPTADATVVGHFADAIPVSSVSLDKTNAEMMIYTQLTLTQTVAPADATVKDVTWESSDETVAAVDNGVVIAKAVGQAVITVTTVDGAKTATCAVTVKPLPANEVFSGVAASGVNFHVTHQAAAVEISDTVATITGGQMFAYDGHASSDADMVVNGQFNIAASGASYIQVVLPEALRKSDVIVLYDGQPINKVNAFKIGKTANDVADATFPYVAKNLEGETTFFIKKSANSAFGAIRIFRESDHPELLDITLGGVDILDAMVDSAYSMDVTAYSEIPVVAATANALGKVEITQATAGTNYVATVVLKDNATDAVLATYTITFNKVNVIDGFSFTWTTGDGYNTSSPIVSDPEGYKSIRVSTVNPLFAIKSKSNSVYNDGNFKVSMGENNAWALVVPANARVSKVEFLGLKDNYYGGTPQVQFHASSTGAGVVLTDANGDTLTYLTEAQTVTATLSNHTTGAPIVFWAEGGSQIAFSGIKIYYAITDNGTLTKIGQSIEAGAVLSRSGKISVTFDNNVSLVAGAGMMINGQPISTEASGAKIEGCYVGLQYGQNYTLTLAANSVKDPFDNFYTEAISIAFFVRERETVDKAAFDAIVSNGTELAAAIATANNRADQNVRYRIFIKPGAHILPTNGSTTTGGDGQTYDDPRTTLTANNVSIIGEDYNTTSFTNTTPAANWDNGYGPACPLEGIGKGDVLINKGTANYFQGVKIKTSMGDAHGRDIAFNDQGKKTIFKDAALWGYQDTYVSNNSNDGRFYFEGGLLRGRTDYLCGKGDVYYNEVTLQCVGGGGYIAVPSQPTKYGYIFNNCHITKETPDVTYHFGRPWGKGTPIALFINTLVDAAPISAGWAEMSGGWPDRFAEYNTYTTQGKVSTANRKNTYATDHTCNPVLSADEATYYSNLTRILAGNDGWDPTEATEQVGVDGLTASGYVLSWDNNDYASSWMIFKDGQYVANVINPTYTVDAAGTYVVRAANAMGGLGAKAQVVVSTATGVQNVEDTVHSIKMLRDGRVIIVRGNRTYNLLGSQIR